MSKTWGEARDAYSKMKKSEIFTDMLEEAKLDKSKFTQSGAENSMATQLRQLAKNDKRMALVVVAIILFLLQKRLKSHF